MDVREYIGDMEETVRSIVDGVRKRIWTMMPVKVTKDSDDGHVAEARSVLKGITTDLSGKVQHEQMPIMPDLPIFFIKGGSNVTTIPTKKDDEGIVIFGSRAMDRWHQKGDEQNQLEARMHTLADGVLLQGVRSDPKKLKHVSQESQQHRSEDLKHVVDVHPEKGIASKSVDKSDNADNPWKDAKKYYQSKTYASDGIEHRANDNDKFHRVEVTHEKGSRVLADNDKHELSATPAGLKAMTEKAFQIATQLGTNIAGGANVDKIAGGQASFGQGAFGMLSAMMANGKMFNFGGDSLGGDLRGKLPEPKVISILNVEDAHLLPNYASPEEARDHGIKQGRLFRTGPMMMIQILEDLPPPET